MKKGIIIAIAMVLAGIILIMAGGIAVGFDFKKFDNSNYSERAVEIADTFSSITADGGDIRLLPSEDGKCRAILKESDKINYSLHVENGMLTITRNDERKWYDYIGFNAGNYGATLYLPESEYDSLKIHVFSGDIDIPEGFVFHSANLETASGSISCFASIADNLFAECKSGSMDIGNANAKGVSLSQSSGSVKLSNVNSAGDISISVSSGSIRLENIQCENMDVRSSSGDTKLNSVVVSGTVNIKSSSGDIRLDGCDAAEFKLKSSSGDIRGALLSNKVFNVHTSSGSIKVPDSLEGSGTFDADVSSGDVKITIE